VIAVRPIDDWSNVHRPLEPIGEVTAAIRDLLERSGIDFKEDPDPGLPSPCTSTAIELSSGVQYAFEHFYIVQRDQLTVRSEPGGKSPARRMEDLRLVLGFAESEVMYVEPDWSSWPRATAT
jgi:hypothetical protein